MYNFMFYLLFVNVLNGLFTKRTNKLNWLQLIPLAIGAIQAGLQAHQANQQKKEAKKALSYKNPYIDESAALAQSQAKTQRYAGQDIDEANVRQGVSDTFGNISRSSKSSGDILNAASKLNGAQQRSFQDIAKTRLNFNQNAMDKYRQVLTQQAGVQDQNRSYSENLKGAAGQNQYNAVNSALGGLAAWGTQKQRSGSWGYGTPGYQQNTGWGAPGSTGSYNWGF